MEEGGEKPIKGLGLSVVIDFDAFDGIGILFQRIILLLIVVIFAVDFADQLVHIDLTAHLRYVLVGFFPHAYDLFVSEVVLIRNHLRQHIKLNSISVKSF